MRSWYRSERPSRSAPADRHCDPKDRFAPHLLAEPGDDGHSGFANVQAFLACDVAELWSYRRYIDEESPFATHHGVKGAQFERVLVVIDDEEYPFSRTTLYRGTGSTITAIRAMLRAIPVKRSVRR